MKSPLEVEIEGISDDVGTKVLYIVEFTDHGIRLKDDEQGISLMKKPHKKLISLEMTCVKN